MQECLFQSDHRLLVNLAITAHAVHRLMVLDANMSFSVGTNSGDEGNPCCLLQQHAGAFQGLRQHGDHCFQHL